MTTVANMSIGQIVNEVVNADILMRMAVGKYPTILRKFVKRFNREAKLAAKKGRRSFEVSLVWIPAVHVPKIMDDMNLLDRGYQVRRDEDHIEVTY